MAGVDIGLRRPADYGPRRGPIWIAVGKRVARSLRSATSKDPTPKGLKIGIGKRTGNVCSPEVVQPLSGLSRFFRLSVGCAKSACLRLLTGVPFGDRVSADKLSPMIPMDKGLRALVVQSDLWGKRRAPLPHSKVPAAPGQIGRPRKISYQARGTMTNVPPLFFVWQLRPLIYK